MRSLFQQVLDGIPQLQRETIEMAFYRGMSQREIARATNTPLGTIKTRLELGLRKMASHLRTVQGKI
jgi:RNA polymerase sigma-70 factor, ECF subfamily